ncbi:MAG: transcriptional regulator [Haloplasmataceae bacterium]|jgi:AcrR family transcriptional regulator|nr:transcriptional regulator [Haloplasmataceae bacterium]
MVNKHDSRSEETKNTILNVAGKLFSKKGYESVTMREIAKEAGCSHTTIYLYFKDKETLLHQLTMPSLRELHQTLQEIHIMNSIISEDKLKRISHEYLHFCMINRNMYSLLMNAKSTRVDEERPELEINKVRIGMFNLLKQVIQECLLMPNNDLLLAFTRTFYYNLNGIISTYLDNHEPLSILMERLTPTFNLAVEVLILGFREKLKQKVETN